MFFAGVLDLPREDTHRVLFEEPALQGVLLQRSEFPVEPLDVGDCVGPEDPPSTPRFCRVFMPILTSVRESKPLRSRSTIKEEG